MYLRTQLSHNYTLAWYLAIDKYVWLNVLQKAEFLSDFGGTIGLWVGASFMTAVEFIDLAAQLIHFRCRKKKKKRDRQRKKQFTQNTNHHYPPFTRENIRRMNRIFNSQIVDGQQDSRQSAVPYLGSKSRSIIDMWKFRLFSPLWLIECELSKLLVIQVNKMCRLVNCNDKIISFIYLY